MRLPALLRFGPASAFPFITLASVTTVVGASQGKPWKARDFLPLETSFRYIRGIATRSGCHHKVGRPADTQSTMEVPMEPQPLGDTSPLVQAIQDLTQQIARMQRQLDFLLDNSPFGGQYHSQSKCQEQYGARMQELDSRPRYYSRDKNDPPHVPRDTLIQCVRCHRKWVPHAKRPKKCPTCKAPWWFPPKWKRTTANSSLAGTACDEYQV